jgi:hypothetical protein
MSTRKDAPASTTSINQSRIRDDPVEFCKQGREDGGHAPQSPHWMRPSPDGVSDGGEDSRARQCTEGSAHDYSPRRTRGKSACFQGLWD